DQAFALSSRSGHSQLVVGVVRTPLRRNRRNYARQRAAADRCRRRFHRRVPGRVGEGRSGGSGARVRGGTRALARHTNVRSRYHLVTTYFIPSITGWPSCIVHGFGLPSNAMLFHISIRPRNGASVISRYLKAVAPPLTGSLR